MIQLIDGLQTDQISASDRGLQFGDGCFTTALVNQGQIHNLNAHLQRLQQDCQALAIPYTEWDLLRHEMQQLAATTDRAVLKVIVTRGRGGRGYSCQGAVQPCRIVSCSAYPHHYAQWQKSGITLRTSGYRLGSNSALAGIKHLNRLEQILIKQELDHYEDQEALVLDHHGDVIECCTANLFYRQGQHIYTPSLAQSGVNGTMRRLLLKLLPKMGFICQVIPCRPEALQQADEVFVCNALMPVLPVIKIDDWYYPRGELSERLYHLVLEQSHYA